MAYEYIGLILVVYGALIYLCDRTNDKITEQQLSDN